MMHLSRAPYIFVPNSCDDTLCTHLQTTTPTFYHQFCLGTATCTLVAMLHNMQCPHLVGFENARENFAYAKAKLYIRLCPRQIFSRDWKRATSVQL